MALQPWHLSAWKIKLYNVGIKHQLLDASELTYGCDSPNRTHFRPFFFVWTLLNPLLGLLSTNVPRVQGTEQCEGHRGVLRVCHLVFQRLVEGNRITRRQGFHGEEVAVMSFLGHGQIMPGKTGEQQSGWSPKVAGKDGHHQIGNWDVVCGKTCFHRVLKPKLEDRLRFELRWLLMLGSFGGPISAHPSCFWCSSRPVIFQRVGNRKLYLTSHLFHFTLDGHLFNFTSERTNISLLCWLLASSTVRSLEASLSLSI